ncbi:MAG TPA: DUF502 domain-containing protein [Dissulfurispiraceae bacterium]|nr:DUF502 domain-containing protein [Dissulfurispiraceae bacterium]
MKKVTRYFFEGLLFLVPLAATLYVLWFVFTKIDGLFRFSVPGLGVLATLIVITSVGFIASNFFTRWIVLVVDNLFRRLPLVKMIYTALKDLIAAFVGEKKSFNQPVAVELVPGSQVKVIGFITQKSLEAFGMTEDVAVYLPQSYNFAGNLIVVPRSRVQEIPAESGQVMAFLVSGGIAAK